MKDSDSNSNHTAAFIEKEGVEPVTHPNQVEVVGHIRQVHMLVVRGYTHIKDDDI